MFKRMIATAGDLTSYVWYLPIVFALYALYDVFLTNGTSLVSEPLRPILGLAYMMLLSPFVTAGLFGAICEQQGPKVKANPDGFLAETYGEQGTEGNASAGKFLAAARRNFWRIAGANFISLFLLVAGIVALGFTAGPGNTNSAGDAFSKYADIPISGVSLFWCAALVAEGDLFPSLGRGLKVLLNPLALGIAIVWGLSRFADSVFLEALNNQPSVALRVGSSAILAVFRVICVIYALAVYRQIRGEYLQPVAPERNLEPSRAASNGLINAGFGFAFAAFLPLIHLVALALGIVALKRSQRFVLRSAIACTVGGFFTAFYLLLIAGILISANAPSRSPTYAFLAETNADLTSDVGLLQKGSFSEVEKHLESPSANAAHDWTTDAALAIAKLRQNNLDGALERFYAAAQGKPERSEFYFYYGLALLENNQQSMAADQFRLAVAHSPSLPEATRYANLVENIYTLPPIASAGFSMLALWILFALHEYAHAFAAWKLGDDTARNAGRLTLNPIKHLDLFGSIILPGLLLWRQTGVIFGWAKPTPVNPQNFKEPLRDHMRVSFAGPAVNLLISMACFVLLGSTLLAVRWLWPETLTWHIVDPFSPVSLVGPPFAHWLVIAIVFLKQLMYTSLALGFFNLLPIPPLDGSWILSGFLPQGLRGAFEQIRRFGFVLFLLLALTPFLSDFLSLPILVFYGGLRVIGSIVGLS